METARVSYTDPEGVGHSTFVEASSLHEAVALAVAKFQADGVPELPMMSTVFEVQVLRASTSHTIDLNTVKAWAKRPGGQTPKIVMQRAKIRELLGIKDAG